MKVHITAVAVREAVNGHRTEALHILGLCPGSDESGCAVTRIASALLNGVQPGEVRKVTFIEFLQMALDSNSPHLQTAV